MRSLAALLAFLLLLGGAIGTAEAQTKKKKPKPKSVSGLRTDLASVRHRQKLVLAELRHNKKKATAVVEDIRTVDRRLATVEEKLAQTTEHLGKNRQAQKKLGAELVSTTQRLEQTREQLRKRLKAMYVAGDETYFSVLVESGSLGDLASRSDFMHRVARSDRQLFDEYAALRRAVTDRKHRQDELVRRIAGLVDTQARQQDDLEDAKVEKKAVLSGLRARQEKLQQLLAQFERDERSIEASIVAYLARAARTTPGGKGRIAMPAFKGRFSAPVRGRMTSGYGSRFHPILHRRRMHTGVDFGAPTGTPIYAAADGVVIAASYMRGYGNTVILDHGSNLSTVYAHTSRIFVRSGARVRRGQRIAAVGSTGLSTGPHLHFEVRVSGRPVNPLGRF